MEPHNNQYPPVGGHGMPPGPPREMPGSGKAVAALVLGICALVVPIPFIDVVAGIIGIVLAVQAKKEGHTGGMATAGLVLSIIGTIFASMYTLGCVALLLFNTDPWMTDYYFWADPWI